MLVAIHQPEHLPWLGFFDKVAQADVFVLLDTVPYSKGGFQNRNRIRTGQGSMWLTVPVRTGGKFGQPIREVKINNRTSPRWREKAWRSIEQHYGKTPFFATYADPFADVYRREWNFLSDLNTAIITAMVEAMGIATRLCRASSLDPQGVRSDLLVDICRKLGARTYLSGISGRSYLDEKPFQSAAIEVLYQEFRHPIYSQLWEPFAPAMSAIDLLFNCGAQSLNILTSEHTPRLEHLFT